MDSRNDRYSPGRPPLFKVAFWTVPCTVIVWAVADIGGAPQWVSTLLLVTGFVVLLAAGWWVYRTWQAHTELPANLRRNLAAFLRVDLPPGSLVTSGHTFGSFLHPGPPRKVSIKVSGLPPMEGDTIARILHVTGELAGDRYVLDGKKSKAGKRVVLRKKPKEKPVELTPRQAVELRITEGARGLFPKHAPKVVCTWDEGNEEEDYLLSVEITEVDGMEMALSGKRRQILTKLRSRVPRGNFTTDVDPTANAIYFFRAKPLPVAVVPPCEHAPVLASHAAYREFSVSLGFGDNLAPAVWCPRKDAHLLIIGGTGGGKTIAEHNIIQRLAQAGWRVWLIDGKRIEFIGYRNWPNVEILAQRVDAQIRALKLAHETMEARYDLIERGDVRIDELDPIVVVVDELTSMLGAVKRRYQETKNKRGAKGMPAKDPVLEWVADIARLGRSAKMHLVLGLQRPDASIMGGEMRDNFGGRISLGRLQSKEASMMMWDDPAIGVAVPSIKGRGVSLVDGAPGLIQGAFVANPDPNHDDYHRGMVEFMRPRIVAYSRKTITEPWPDGDDGDDEIAWQDIIAASLVDPQGQPVVFDPVSSEESRKLRRGHTARALTDANSQLQVADSFSAALDLFSYDPAEHLQHGQSLACHLSALADRLHAESAVPQDDGNTGGHRITNDVLSRSHAMELRYVEPGQTILVDDIGGEEVIVAQCEPDQDDPQLYYLAGYTPDGEPVHVELAAETTVEVFEDTAALAGQE